MAFLGSWGQWYEESEHPRGTGGRWVSKGGGAGSTKAHFSGLLGAAAIKIPRGQDKFGLNGVEQLIMRAWKMRQSIEIAGTEVDYDQLRASDDFSNTLNKLPLFKGRVYRGMHKTAEVLAKKFKKGAVVTFTKHSSGSSARTIATEFAKRGWKASEGEQSVMLEIETRNGRKLPQIYASGIEQREIVIPKGSKFKVTKVSVKKFLDEEDPDINDQGDIVFHRRPMTIVTLKEVADSKPSDETPVLKDGVLPSQSVMLSISGDKGSQRLVEVLINPTARDVEQMAKEKYEGTRLNPHLRLTQDYRDNVYVWMANDAVHTDIASAKELKGRVELNPDKEREFWISKGRLADRELDIIERAQRNVGLAYTPQDAGTTRQGEPARGRPKPETNPLLRKWKKDSIPAFSMDQEPMDWTESRPEDEVFKDGGEAVFSLGSRYGTEFGVLTMNRGRGKTRVLMLGGADKHHLDFKDYEFNAMTKPGDRWKLVHNHPSTCGPSAGDTVWLNRVKTLDVMRVVDSTGGVFSMSLPDREGAPGMWSDEPFAEMVERLDDGMSIDMDGGHFGVQEVRRVCEEQKRDPKDLTETERQEVSKALSFLRGHARNLQLAKAGFVKFEFRLSKQQQQWLKQYAPSFKRCKAVARKSFQKATPDRLMERLNWEADEPEQKKRAA